MGNSEERDRRARAHAFAGVAAGVVAIGAVPLFGWLAGIAIALVAAGHLLAARGLRRAGEVTPAAWALIVVGGLGFLAVCVLLVLRLTLA